MSRPIAAEVLHLFAATVACEVGALVCRVFRSTCPHGLAATR